MQVAWLGPVYHFRRLDEYPTSPNPSFLLPHLFFFPNRPTHGPYGYSPTCSWINILYERKLCVSDRMAELGSFTCDSTCQWGCVPFVGFAACRSDRVRVRCDRDSRAQVYLLIILKTLGKLGKNVWRSLAMQGLDPNKISTYVLGVLVLKKKGGVFLRGILSIQILVSRVN